MKARVRGIYATALTEALLDAGHEVVGASTPIRRRFDAEFEKAPPDARIATTEDRHRQGVARARGSDAIGTLRGLLTDTGLDALAWTDPTRQDRLRRDGDRDARRWGSVVRLRVGGGESEGDATTEGYLPYGSVDDRIETGDPVRVQVRESAAPWTDRRPELDGSLRAGGGLVTLEPGSGPRRRAERQGRARAVGNARPARTEAAGGVARRLEAARGRRRHRGAAGRTRPGGRGRRRGAGRRRRRGGRRRRSRRFGQRSRGAVDAPNAGVWVWFGRESRFALDDDRRREATATMPGHHRVKAGADASSGVDLAEALCEPDADASFPFGVVTDAFGPAEGDAPGSTASPPGD